MSESVQETEEFLHQQLFGGAAKSVGEAVEQQEERRVVPAAPPPEDAPIVVEDEPPGRDTEPVTPEPELPAEPAAEPEEGDIEGDIPEDEGIVWAKRKYGDDPEKWARAAYEQERHITALGREKHESDELAAQWYEYAQQVEQAQQAQLGASMPLSAQEEQWIENSLTNPVEFARQAAYSGRVHLYTGVINRVAEENPGLAAQIGTQVQMEMQQVATQQQSQQQGVTLESALGASFGRMGIDLKQEGPRMADKIKELGEYHPYVRAIMGADDGVRDIAVQAVHDLVRATSFSPRQVQRNENLAKENELRRDVASVQTGGMAAPPPPPTDSPLMQGMKAEWERAGQWAGDE